MTESAQHPTVFDTGQQYLGGVYAKALIGAAQKAGIADQILDELGALIDDVMNRLPKLDAALSSPRVPVEDKLAMIDKAFAGKVSPTLLNFLKVVVRHGRFDCLRAVRRAARKLINQMTGRVDVQVTTAEPLNDEMAGRVTSGLERALGVKVNLETEVDSDVIGGLVVRVGDTVYDGSLANRLNRLRQDVYEKTFQAIKESAGRFEIAE